jgi:opacity protein-like surface antigen
MKSFLITVVSIALLSSSINAKDSQPMSNEEFIKKFLKLKEDENKAEQRIKDVKAKTKALQQLESSIDELAKKLKVDK